MPPARLYNVYNYKNQRKYIGPISSFNAAEQNIEYLYFDALHRSCLFPKQGKHIRRINQTSQKKEAVIAFKPQSELSRMAEVISRKRFLKKTAAEELTRMAIS